MASSRIWTLVVGLTSVAFAGWDLVPEASWTSFGSARSRALGSSWWTDSTHYGLWSLDANPAGLVGVWASPLNVNLSTSGTSLSGGDGRVSHREPVNFELASGNPNTYAFQAHVVDVEETWRDTLGKPTYEISRLRWGFDAAVSATESRAFVLGIGFDGRFPGSQTQDTSGTGAPGTFEHVQYAIESARFGITSRIMESVTLGFQSSVRLSFDSLRYTVVANGDTTNPQLRYARVDLPEIGLGVSVDRAQWPLQATLLFDWARGYRIGVLKNDVSSASYANVDLPQLVNDSLRFVLAVQGRPDRHFPDQEIRPSFAIHWTNSSTQAYDPVAGTSNPLDGGAKAQDSSWSVRRTGIALGLTWSWLDRISVQGSAEGILEGVTARKALYVSGASGDTSLSANDSRLSLGVELSHTLIPAWRTVIPKEDGFALRLGVAYQALSGLSLEPGWFNDVNFDREPGVANSGSTTLYTNNPSLAQLGMLPSLGNHSTELSWTWGLGAWILDHKLQTDLAFSWNTWTPGTRADRTGLGWDAQLRYRI